MNIQEELRALSTEFACHAFTYKDTWARASDKLAELADSLKRHVLLEIVVTATSKDGRYVLGELPQAEPCYVIVNTEANRLVAQENQSAFILDVWEGYK